MCNLSAFLITHNGCGHTTPDPTATVSTIPCTAVVEGRKAACQTYSHRPVDVRGQQQRLVRTTVRTLPGLCARCEAGEQVDTTSGSVSVASSIKVEDEDLVEVDEQIWGPTADDTAAPVADAAFSDVSEEEEDKKEVSAAARSYTDEQKDDPYEDADDEDEEDDDEDDDDDDEMVISPSRATPLKRRRAVIPSSPLTSEEDDDETPTKKRRGSGGARMVDVVARFMAARVHSGSGSVGGDHAAPGLSSIFATGGGGVGGGLLLTRVVREVEEEEEEE